MQQMWENTVERHGYGAWPNDPPKGKWEGRWTWSWHVYNPCMYRTYNSAVSLLQFYFMHGILLMLRLVWWIERETRYSRFIYSTSNKLIPDQPRSCSSSSYFFLLLVPLQTILGANRQILLGHHSNIFAFWSPLLTGATGRELGQF